MLQKRVLETFKNFQRDIVDQAQLHQFKDLEKNNKLRRLFESFASILGDRQGLESLERLRKKVTHDIEHQIGELIKLRKLVSEKVNIETEEIKVPVLKQ